MWPFSSKKSKRRSGLQVPLWRDEPYIAYLERIWPKSYHGVRLKKKLPPEDGILDREEHLEDIVRMHHGGGKYKAKCFDQRDKRIYIGTYDFRIRGEPLIKGRPIEPRD
jgi:hypothetical protein